MTNKRARKGLLDAASQILETATGQLPRRRLEVEALVSRVERGRHDRRCVVDAGRAVDEMIRGKRYRALGHGSLEAWVLSIGISRTTAYAWRALAKEADAGATRLPGRRAPIRTASVRAMRAAEIEARALAKRLRAHGLDATVTAIARDGVAAVRIEIGVKQAGRIG